MSLVSRLIDEAAGSGLVLVRRGERLSCAGTTATAPSLLMHSLKAHKQEILSELGTLDTRCSHLGTQVEASLPLSPLKTNVFYECLLKPDALAYNMSFTFEALGRFHVEAWRQAWTAVMTRHCDLRSLYLEDDGALRQWVLADPQVPLQLVDVSGESAPQRSRQTDFAADRVLRRPFELSSELPFRLGVCTLGPEHHILFVCLHHIVADADTLALLLREVRNEYSNALNGSGSKTPRAEMADVLRSVQHYAWTLTGECRDQIRHWCEELRDTPPLLEKSAPHTAVGPERLEFSLSTDQTRAVRRFAAAQGKTPFVVVLTAYSKALWRVTGKQEFLIGIPARALSDAVSEGALGCFLNLLPLRISGVQADAQALLERISHRFQEALSRNRVPLNLVRQHIASERRGRMPDVEAVITFVTQAFRIGEWPGLVLRYAGSSISEVKFPINAQLQMTDRELSGHIELSGTARGNEALFHLPRVLEEELSQLAGSSCNERG